MVSKVLDYIRNNNGGILFLNTAGGTGKTFATNLLLFVLFLQINVVLAVASSGIAATLSIQHLQTLYLHYNETPICKIKREN